MRWLPNLLTLARLLLLPPILILPILEDASARGWALGLFLVAAATDFLDGWLALALAVWAGLWSMFTLFRDNADLWRRAPLAMERR